MKLLSKSLLVFWCLSALTTHGQTDQKKDWSRVPHWSFELHGGIVANAKLPLTIRQQGYPDIYIAKAEFYSEPLISPWYWDWRFSKWFKGRGISFEAIHHKLYLRNKPPEVQRFGISHGFNMCVFSYFYVNRFATWHVGLGSVLAHPESTVRGLQYPEGPGFDLYGYRLRGLVLNLAAGKRIYLGRRGLLNIEAKLTAARATVPIVQGSATVNNIAIQLIFGPGINWAYRDESKN